NRAVNAGRAKWGSTPEENHQKRSERLSEARRKGTHTDEQWEAMKEEFGSCCVRCGRTEPDVELVKDHIVPMYQGGSDGIENLQPLCRYCNSSKGPDSTDLRQTCSSHFPGKMPAERLRDACGT